MEMIHVLNNANDINGLDDALDLIAEGVIPDFKRLYLEDRVMTESDPTHYELFRGLLRSYDRGLIDMTIDPWERCIKYFACEIN